MKKNISNSVIGIVEDIPWGTHFCQFYQTKEDLIEVIGPYFKAGLEKNEFCIWVTSGSFELEDAKRILEKNIPDFNAYLKRGQIEIIPYSNWFLKEGVFNSERILAGYLKMLNQALADGYNGLRVIEDTSWLRKEYWNYFADYEEKLGSLISSHQIIFLHPYCLDIINGTETTDLISSHQISLIKKKGKWQRIENPLQKDRKELKLAEEAPDQAHEKIQAQSEEVKEANRALCESDKRLQVIVTNSPDIIFEQDCNLRYIWIYNPAPPLTPSDLIGKTDADIFPPDQAQLLASIKCRVLETGIREEAILQLSPSGEKRWYEAIYEPKFDEAGKVIGLVSYSRDVTRRKKVENALRKSEEQYRMLFTNMGEGFGLAEIIYDKDGKPYDYRYLELNPAFELQTGIKKEKLLGKSVLELFPNPDPAEIEKLNEVALLGKPTYYEVFRQALNKHFGIYLFSPEKGKLAAIFRDITERKKAEEDLKNSYDTSEVKVKERTKELEEAYRSLKESEESLAEAQKIAHIGNWKHNFATNKILWSDEMYRIFGLKPQEFEVTYDLFLSYVHPDDRDHINNVVKRALNGEPLDIDFRIILANEEEKIVYAKGEVIFDDENIPVLIRGITQDITERKRVEEALNQVTEHERFLADVVEKADMPFGVGLPDGKLLIFNQAFANLLGYSHGELVQKHWSFDLTPPEWHKYEAMQLNEAIRTRKPVRYEKEYFRKNGTRVPVELFVHPVFDTDGNLLNFRTFVTDITERKKAEENLKSSEERYRSFIQNFKGIAFQIDEKFNLEFIHGAIKEITGYNEEELFSDIPWKQLVVPEDMDVFLIKEKEAVHSPGEYRGEFDYRIRNKDGKIKWMHEIHQKISEKDGRHLRYIGMIYDITDKKEAEEFLAKIEIARQKEIHHRIKNNLQVISSLLDLQTEKFKNREHIDYSEFLEALNESQDRVMSIALIHEELHEGKEVDKLNFSIYLQRLADNLFQTCKLESANVSLNLDLEENIFFDMDTAVPLGMIVNEIISNSLKYAFAGRNKGEIQIKLHRREGTQDGNPGYVLNISDNGIGIPKNIDFENPETLGLQLVNILVDQIDGSIELKRNKGTEFIIRFTGKEI